MSEIFDYYDSIKDTKEKHFLEEWFKHGYNNYEVQLDNWSETIFSITSKMASENLPNEQKTIFRSIILDYAEKNWFPTLNKWDKIIFEPQGPFLGSVELQIWNETYFIDLTRKTVIKN